MTKVADSSQVRCLKHEYDILTSLPISPHVVLAHDFRLLTDGGAEMAMEFAGTDIMRYVERDVPFSDSFAPEVFKQTVCAISFLHANGVAHRDVKMENVLVLESVNFSLPAHERLHVRIVDFGLARSNYCSELETSVVGSLPYIPPEVFEKKKGDRVNPFAHDAWSVGVLAFNLAARIRPWNLASSKKDERFGMFETAVSSSSPFESVLSLYEGLDHLRSTTWLKDALNACLVVCPFLRLTSWNALSSPHTTARSVSEGREE